MNKQIKIILKGEAEDSFDELNSIVLQQIKNKVKGSFEMKLLKSIKDKLEILKLNPFYGDPIRKNLIPKEFNVQSLWRIELANYWRMLYTIRGDDVRIVCFILEICDHDKYNKLFGYKKR
jgi:hypothetical protein